MNATTFDTLAAARELEAAGMARGQAEAVAAVVRAGHGDLATKADLRAEISAAIIKMMLSQVAIAGALLAAIKLIP